jgi:hypothetical protein
MTRAAVSGLVAAAAIGFAVNLDAGIAFAFVAAACVSVFFRRGTLPPAVAILGKRLLQLALVLMVILGWILVTYPILSTSTLRLLSLTLGYTFGVLASVFLLTDGVRPREGAIPAGVGLLVVSAFDLDSRLHPYLIAAGAAGFLYLASEVLSARAPRRWARTGVLAGFAVASAATAVGIVHLLPWTQAKIEEAMIAALAPGAHEGEGERRLGDRRSLRLSKKVVMRVYSERPQKLRSRVLVRFDGTGWHPGSKAIRILAPGRDAGLDESERTFLQSIPGKNFASETGILGGKRRIQTTVIRVDEGGLATPGGSVLVHAPLESVQVDVGGILRAPPRTTVRWYGVLHDVDHRLAQEGALEGKERESMLQLPEKLDPRIRELGRALVEGESSPERAVEKVVSHLRSEYQYSIDIGAGDVKDPLGDFLFGKKEGWCQHFATSAAILLRTQGIPARYVAGFNVIGSQKKSDYYVVRERDRHAWIEAYIEGKGWVEYDPTPAAAFESLQAGAGDEVWADAWEWVSARGSMLYLRLRNLDAVSIAVFLGVSLAASVLYRLVRRPRKAAPKTEVVETPKAPPTGLEPLVAKLDRLAAERGYPRGQSAAPLEHWQKVPVSDAQRKAGLRILESFYRARFGGVPISPEEAERLARELEPRERVSGGFLPRRARYG